MRHFPKKINQKINAAIIPVKIINNFCLICILVGYAEVSKPSVSKFMKIDKNQLAKKSYHVLPARSIRL